MTSYLIWRSKHRGRRISISRHSELDQNVVEQYPPVVFHASLQNHGVNGAWTGIARRVHSREELQYPPDMGDAV